MINRTHVWVTLEEVAGLTRREIEEKMTKEAKYAGMIPILNERTGRADIYLRTKYVVEAGERLITEDKRECDGYVMYVEDLVIL